MEHDPLKKKRLVWAGSIVLGALLLYVFCASNAFGAFSFLRGAARGMVGVLRDSFFHSSAPVYEATVSSYSASNVSEYVSSSSRSEAGNVQESVSLSPKKSRRSRKVKNAPPESIQSSVFANPSSSAVSVRTAETNLPKEVSPLPTPLPQGPEINNPPVVVSIPQEIQSLSTSSSPQSTSSIPSPAVNNSLSHLVIYEIQITGGAGKSDEDFIKIFNPTTQTVDLENWKLRKRIQSGTESSIRVFPKGSSIQPGGVFTWANANNGFDASVHAGASSTQTLTANSSIALFDNTGALVDAIAWGTGHANPFIEGNAFSTNPVANEVLTRKMVGSDIVDTDDNAGDFSIM